MASYDGAIGVKSIRDDENKIIIVDGASGEEATKKLSILNAADTLVDAGGVLLLADKAGDAAALSINGDDQLLVSQKPLTTATDSVTVGAVSATNLDIRDLISNRDSVAIHAFDEGSLEQAPLSSINGSLFAVLPSVTKVVNEVYDNVTQQGLITFARETEDDTLHPLRMFQGELLTQLPSVTKVVNEVYDNVTQQGLITFARETEDDTLHPLRMFQGELLAKLPSVTRTHNEAYNPMQQEGLVIFAQEVTDQSVQPLYMINGDLKATLTSVTTDANGGGRPPQGLQVLAYDQTVDSMESLLLDPNGNLKTTNESVVNTGNEYVTLIGAVEQGTSSIFPLTTYNGALPVSVQQSVPVAVDHFCTLFEQVAASRNIALLMFLPTSGKRLLIDSILIGADGKVELEVGVSNDGLTFENKKMHIFQQPKDSKNYLLNNLIIEANTQWLAIRVTPRDNSSDDIYVTVQGKQFSV